MFKSIGHFFATVFQKALPIIQGAQKTEGTVEAVTALVPKYGPLALPVEKLAYAALGELAAVITAAQAAGAQKLQDAGLDAAVVQSVQALVASVPQFAALAKPQ